MNEQMRAEFEAFAKPHTYSLKMIDGEYTSASTDLLWQCWQASRAALVVELPISVCRTHVFELPHTSEVGMEHDEYYEIDDVKKSLEAAGVSYK